MQVIRGINMRSLTVAGLVAGFMMFFVDRWFAGLFGLFGTFPGFNSATWMISHHVQAVIFAIPFAWRTIYDNLPGAGWMKGMLYGFLWWLIFPLLLGMLAGALGAAPLQRIQPGSLSALLTPAVLHVVYGFFIGVLYTPPEASESMTL